GPGRRRPHPEQAGEPVPPHLLHGHRPRALPAAGGGGGHGPPGGYGGAAARQDGKPEGPSARGRTGRVRGPDDVRARRTAHSSGLLVVTNDHRLGERLTDPAQHVPKTYHARVRGVPEEAALAVVREGLSLGDAAGTVYRPSTLRVLGLTRQGEAWLEIVLTE